MTATLKGEDGRKQVISLNPERISVESSFIAPDGSQVRQEVEAGYETDEERLSFILVNENGSIDA